MKKKKKKKKKSDIRVGSMALEYIFEHISMNKDCFDGEKARPEREKLSEEAVTKKKSKKQMNDSKVDGVKKSKRSKKESCGDLIGNSESFKVYQRDAKPLNLVWDNLLENRDGEACRKRWKQMVLHIGLPRSKTFAEQVEILSNMYRPDLAEDREDFDNRLYDPEDYISELKAM